MKEIIFADGFDSALLGVVNEIDCPRAVYSKAKMVDILQEEGMDWIDAVEHLEYNVWGSFIGENTPLYINDMHGTDRQNLEDHILGLY